MKNRKTQNWIYSKNVKYLVCEEWQPIMQAFINNIEDYLDVDNNYGNNFVISNIKDKYSRLRMEYSGGDDYIDGLVSNIEDLSYYLLFKK